MTDIETRRLDLYNVLQNVLGLDPATTLMSHLLPEPMPDVLTKDEFETFRSGEFSAFKNEFADFRAEMHGFRTEMHEFKTEMHGFKSEMHEFKLEMRDFKTEMRGAIGEANKRIDRVLLAVVAGQFVLIAAIVGTSVL